MTSDLTMFLILAAGLIAMLAIAERLGSDPARRTFVRQGVHALTGVVVLGAAALLSSPVPLIMLAIVFAVVNALAVRNRWLRSYNETGRGSLGTVFYPVSVAALALLFWDGNLLVFCLAVAVLAFADPLAAFAGRRVGGKSVLPAPWDRKTVAGSTAMVAGTWVILQTGFLWPGSGESPGGFAVLSAAFLISAAEGLAMRGSDNLSVPVVTVLAVLFLMTPATEARLAAGVVGAGAIALAALQLKFLDRSGAIAAFLLGGFLYAAGGFAVSVAILWFFISGSVLSRLPGGRRRGGEGVVEKTGRRDAVQVFANGLAPVAAALPLALDGAPVWYAAYVGGVAAVASDTWATEIGIAIGGSPRSILTGQPLRRGESGGVTFWGTAGAIAGAATVVLAGWLAAPAAWRVWAGWQGAAVLVTAGFAGQLADSLLGAIAQRKNRCVACGARTERDSHCGSGTRHDAGLRWLDNDGVNFVTSLVGVFFAYVVWQFLLD